MSSSEPQVDATTEPKSQLKRESSDIGWEWGRLVDPNDKNRVKCLLCGHESTGGIHRFKQHLGHVGSAVAQCKKDLGLNGFPGSERDRLAHDLHCPLCNPTRGLSALDDLPQGEG